jgi:hypothetical protein
MFLNKKKSSTKSQDIELANFDATDSAEVESKGEQSQDRKVERADINGPPKRPFLY